MKRSSERELFPKLASGALSFVGECVKQGRIQVGGKNAVSGPTVVCDSRGVSSFVSPLSGEVFFVQPDQFAHWIKILFHDEALMQSTKFFTAPCAF